MSDTEYYKQRVNELQRELEAANILSEHLYDENVRLTADLEAAHAELGQYGADIKMLERRLGQEEANRCASSSS